MKSTSWVLCHGRTANDSGRPSAATGPEAAAAAARHRIAHSSGVDGWVVGTSGKDLDYRAVRPAALYRFEQENAWWTRSTPKAINPAADRSKAREAPAVE